MKEETSLFSSSIGKFEEYCDDDNLKVTLPLLLLTHKVVIFTVIEAAERLSKQTIFAAYCAHTLSYRKDHFSFSNTFPRDWLKHTTCACRIEEQAVTTSQLRINEFYVTNDDKDNPRVYYQ